MKVKFFNTHQKSLNWKVVSEPFPKVQVNLVFGRNKRDSVFIPLVGMNDLSDGDYVSLAKNAKGTNVIKPGVANTTDILIFTTIEGGFRGGIRKFNVGGTIVAEASASAACESAISVAAILRDKEEIIIEEYGRYGKFYHIFGNQNGNTYKNKLANDDFNYLYGE